MKLPIDYFEFYPDFSDIPKEKWEFHSLRGFSKWCEENHPEEIELEERQFWNFTALQPLPYEEKYWHTFHGIPLRCPRMTRVQQFNLGILK